MNPMDEYMRRLFCKARADYYEYLYQTYVKETPMTNQTRLDAIDAKIRELQHEADALRADLTKPVTACVGDEVLYYQRRGHIVAPQDGRLTRVRSGPFGQHSPVVSDLTTLDGRKIDRVVPFRISRKRNERWTLHRLEEGYDSGFWSLKDAKTTARRISKLLWPWYDGPAYVVEGDDE